MRKLAGIGATPAIPRHSVRHRLLVIALLPMLVILPLLLGISIYRWNQKFDAALISKVNDDLTIARQYLARIVENTQDQLVSVTNSARFQDALRQQDPGRQKLVNVLRETAQAHGFDFLYVTSDEGRILASEFPFASSPVDQTQKAISPGSTAITTPPTPIFAGRNTRKTK